MYVDEAIIVVDKPAGLVVHPGAGNPDGTLVNGLLARFPEIAGVGATSRPGIVHRLDAGSSGLLVVARTEAARESLTSQFAAHTASRRYVALVWGHPSAPMALSTRRSAAIPPTRRDGGRHRRSPGAHRVRGRRTLHGPADVALLECRLETGRPTRSASTSPPSAIRSSATSSMAPAQRPSASTVRSSTPPSFRWSTRHPARG